ncbi:MAG: hypothetical protein QY323_04580 [Patescibacteria group bacterium]|nr:MAG: hypothetical protein QY323_04580 [Patescibacteria group bacterium]
MKNQVPPDDSLDQAILRYLAENDAEPSADPVFDGIDPDQPLGTIPVTIEDTDRFERMIHDSLDGPDRLGPDDKTFQP